MKKMIAIPIVFALILAMSISAIAATVNADGGSQDVNVTAKYVSGVSSVDVYSVDITWGAMEFTYTASGTRTWNPSTHDYDAGVTGAWTASGNEITVVNHSNVGIKAQFGFSALSEYNTVFGTFSVFSLNLPSASGKPLDAPELRGTTSLVLSGTLDRSITGMTKVGTITVTISSAGGGGDDTGEWDINPNY